MPGTAYFFPKPNHPADHPQTLIAFLSNNPSSLTLARGLEEFAWRSLVDGKRVRAYCAEVSHAIARLSPNAAALTCSALSTPLLSPLFPLVNLAPYHVKDITPRIPPALLPSSALLGISQKQVIEILSRLSKDRAVVDGKVQGVREQILELCLEYIGWCWRTEIYSFGDTVGVVARRLSEIELELQGDPITIQSFFVPVICALRQHLGFISSSQLVTRLERQQPPTAWSGIVLEPRQLVTAWIVVRLRAGMEPHRLVDGLLSVKTRLHTSVDEEAISDVLEVFGLLGRSATAAGSSILGLSGLMPASDEVGQDAIATPQNTYLPPEPRSTILPKPRLSPCKVPRKGSYTTSGKRWWSHRWTDSSAARLHDTLTTYKTDRRPSLPFIFAGPRHGQVSPSRFDSPASVSQSSHHSSSSSVDTTTSAVRRHSRLTIKDTLTVTDLLGSLMTYDNPDDIRFILLDYLLAMRYRLSVSQTDDWCLGYGQLVADETLTKVEARLVGRKDVMGLRPIFANLRAIFDLPLPLSTDSCGFKARHRSGSLPAHHAPIRVPAPDRPVVAPLPRDAGEPLESSVSDRDTSFDLERYLLDIAPLEDDEVAGSPTCAIQSGEWPALKQTRRPAHCTSMLSIFSIKQATPSFPQQTSATQLRLPHRAIPLLESDSGAYSAYVVEGSIDHAVAGAATSDRCYGRYDKRVSRSESDLSSSLKQNNRMRTQDATNASASDTALVSPNSLRRVSRMRGRLHHHISAYEFGLAHALPRVPATPTLPPVDFNAVENFCGTPIAVPSVPAISPAASSLSSGSVQPAANKNLAGLDTPPASPPAVTSATISHSLDTPLRQTPQLRPASHDSQRQFHRQCSIVDGAQISPSRYHSASGAQPDEDKGCPAGGWEEDQRLRRRTSVSSTAGQPVFGLRSILRLFDTAGETIQLQAGVSDEDVRKVVKQIVNVGEQGLEQRTWLLHELSGLLGPDFAPMINYYLSLMDFYPPLQSPISLRKSHLALRAAGNDSRHSAGSLDFRLTPPPVFPSVIRASSVDPSNEHAQCIVNTNSARTSRSSQLPTESVTALHPRASTHTFGTPGLS